MIFADLVAGASVFVDANTLVYHFQPHPVFGSPCTDLVERIEQASNDADFDRVPGITRYAPARPTRRAFRLPAETSSGSISLILFPGSPPCRPIAICCSASSRFR